MKKENSLTDSPNYQQGNHPLIVSNLVVFVLVCVCVCVSEEKNALNRTVKKVTWDI
jgi:hypothetical protein